jgi:hypothetical protein
VRELDLYSLRHTFASLGRTAGESACNVAQMMGRQGARWSILSRPTRCVGYGERCGEYDRSGSGCEAAAARDRGRPKGGQTAIRPSATGRTKKHGKPLIYRLPGLQRRSELNPLTGTGSPDRGSQAHPHP